MEDKELKKLNGDFALYNQVIPADRKGAAVSKMASTTVNAKDMYEKVNRYASLPTIVASKKDDQPMKLPSLTSHHYQWIIVLACFLNFFIVDGIGNSLSLFYVAFCRDLPYTRSQLSWIISIHYSLTLISGPIASLMVDSVGCGRTNMVGAVLTFVGFSTSSYTSNLWCLIVMIGFVAGLGVSFVYVACYTCIALYFSGQKAVATGLFSCGSGVGALILGPLTNMLIDKYLWNGATLIYSSLYLNLLVTGCLMLRSDSKAAKKPSSIKSRNRGNDIINFNAYSLVNPAECSKCRGNSFNPTDSHSLCSISNVTTRSLLDISKPYLQYSDKLLHLRCMTCIKQDLQKKSQAPTKCQNFHNYLIRLKYIFSDLDYAIFFASNLLLYASGDTPCLFFVDRVVNLGIVENSGVLISLMGVSNTIGHIFFGYISEYGTNRWSSNATVYVYTVAIVVSGIATMTVPIILDYYSSVIYIILLGFFISANYTLTSIITLELVDESAFTTAFGCILTSQGIGALIGAPIGGAMIDYFDNFDMAFYLAGFIIVISGLMISFRPALSSLKMRFKL